MLSFQGNQLPRPIPNRALVTAMVFEVNPALDNPDDLKANEELPTEIRAEYDLGRSGRLTILPCSLSYVSFSHFVEPETLHKMSPTLPDPGPLASSCDAILHGRFEPDQKLGQIEFIFDLGNWNASFTPAADKKYGTILSILQYPFSRGSVHIPPTSSVSAATAKPVIDPQYYGGSNGHLDLEAMVHCQRFAQTICSTKPLANIIRGRAFPPHAISDDELRAWVVDNTVTDWHPVGTCAMGGRDGSSSGVVDERLRVYGVKCLRVVDASIMPLQISAHLQATIYAIAEKAAYMILEDTESIE